MKDWQHQAHVKWEDRYSAEIVPKYRGKAILGTSGVGTRGGEEQCVGPCVQGKKTVRSGKTKVV
jgi:hypothetical protein